jgi:hypothetical protein
MTYSAALVIIAVCVSVVLVLAAPFLYLSHRRRKRRSVNGERVAPAVPKGELPALGAYVLVMFFGFAHAHIAPSTWFGQLISNGTGQVMFLVLPALIVIALRVGWLNYRRRRSSARQ